MTFLNRKFSLLKAGLLVLGLVAMTTSETRADTSAETNMKFGITFDVSLAIRPFMEKDKIAIGGEGRDTLFFEYKFADWFGLRTGLGYAKTVLISLPTSKSSNSITNLFDLRILSVPLVARFYPGEERQFSLYIGPRFGWIVAGKKLENIDDDTNWDKIRSGSEDISSKDKKFHRSLDLGFDYETSFGLFFGMEGLGLALGYNFGALL